MVVWRADMRVQNCSQARMCKLFLEMASLDGSERVGYAQGGGFVQTAERQHNFAE